MPLQFDRVLKAICSRQKVQSNIRKWQPWKEDVTGWCTAQAYDQIHETCDDDDDDNHNHLIIISALALGGVLRLKSCLLF